MPRSSKVLLDSLQQLIVKETETRIKADIQKLRDDTEEYVEVLNKFYGAFFGNLLKDLNEYHETPPQLSNDEEGELGGQATPPRLAPYLNRPWRGLSGGWLETKASVAQRARGEPGGFYQGITEHLAYLANGPLRPTGKLGNTKMRQGLAGLSRAAGGRKSRSNVVPFSRFLGSHKNDLAYVNKVFGKIEIDYELKSSGKTLKTKVVNQVITSVKHPDKKTMPKSYQVKATVSAFGAVISSSGGFNEWQVVDKILKQRDPANERQWVKINGHRDHMRPVITPMIRWFFAIKFKSYTKDFLMDLK